MSAITVHQMCWGMTVSYDGHMSFVAGNRYRLSLLALECVQVVPVLHCFHWLLDVP